LKEKTQGNVSYAPLTFTITPSCLATNQSSCVVDLLKKLKKSPWRNLWNLLQHEPTSWAHSNQ
jgi:hypothetical protein